MTRPRVARVGENETGRGSAVVVGASLAGLMTGLALSRAGLAVTILERAAAFTRTGAAVALDAGRLAGLARLGVTGLVSRAAGASVPESAPWFALHARLRAAVEADQRVELRSATVVQDVAQDEAWAWPITADGDAVTGHVVIGADGHRSVVRRRVAPERPDATFAGYLIWLGLSEEAGMPPLRRWPQDVAMLRAGDAPFFGYPVPDLDAPRDDAAPGSRRLGWAWYDASHSALLRETGAVVGNVVHHSLTGEGIPDLTYRALADEARRLLPQPWRDAVLEAVGRRGVIGTPIAEYVPERLVSGRLALVGDAAHVPTPMTGSGFAAALQDAEALGAAFGALGTTPQDALLAYERHRLDAARRLVQSGQQFSRGFSREVA
jgi:2-polyprenyl-6-methoxyphenol hydroxylase-like FAD-dependent oxidoreductase